MSAEVLREAARLMRERAKAATQGRPYWHPYGNGGRTLAVDGPVFGGFPTHELNILKTTDDWPPTDADAEHLASWHPAVALAVAALLDDAADVWEVGASIDDPATADGTYSLEIAVARAYLGGAA